MWAIDRFDPGQRCCENNSHSFCSTPLPSSSLPPSLSLFSTYIWSANNINLLTQTDGNCWQSPQAATATATRQHRLVSPTFGNDCCSRRSCWWCCCWCRWCCMNNARPQLNKFSLFSPQSRLGQLQQRGREREARKIHTSCGCGRGWRGTVCSTRRHSREEPRWDDSFEQGVGSRRSREQGAGSRRGREQELHTAGRK